MRTLLLFLIPLALFVPNLAPCKTSPTRHYEKKVTKEEKEHLSFIIRSLGFKSLPKVWSDKSSLKHSGDKIDHLHPLRFLMCVFTDEELKAAMNNLKGRLFVWSEFKKGLYESLTEETKKDNMSLDYIEDFAKKIQIDSRMILRPIQNEHWDDLMQILIKNVPRAGDPKRYDM